MDSNLSEIIKDKSKQFDFPLPGAKLYSQLTEFEKIRVDSKTDNVEVEKAELIYNPENESQIIITQNHLITKGNKVLLSQIVNLSTNKTERKNVRENFDRMVYKFELTKWVIELRDGKSIEIELQKRKAYYSFYHILQKLHRAKGYWK